MAFQIREVLEANERTRQTTNLAKNSFQEFEHVHIQEELTVNGILRIQVLGN